MTARSLNADKTFGPTEHIVQLAISIDDGRIIAGVEEAARNQIVNDLQKKLMLCVFNTKYYGSEEINTSDPKEWVRSRFDEFMEAHKDQIIDAAAKILADKLARSKAAKAILNQ